MKFCPNCGTKVSDDTVFCPNCGHKIGDVTGSNQPGQRPTQHNQNRNYSVNSNDRLSHLNQGSLVSTGQRVQVTPPPCGMGQAFKLFWNNYINFSGYSTRSKYWFVVLWNLIINVGLAITIVGIVVIPFYWLATLLPNLALWIRRIRDAGISNGWIIALVILLFVPIVDILVGIVIFVITLLPSVRYK